MSDGSFQEYKLYKLYVQSFINEWLFDPMFYAEDEAFFFLRNILTRINDLIFILQDVQLYIWDQWRSGHQKKNGKQSPGGQAAHRLFPCWKEEPIHPKARPKPSDPAPLTNSILPVRRSTDWEQCPILAHTILDHKCSESEHKGLLKSTLIMSLWEPL